MDTEGTEGAEGEADLAIRCERGGMRCGRGGRGEHGLLGWGRGEDRDADWQDERRLFESLKH
jgi:hypothetical protein